MLSKHAAHESLSLIGRTEPSARADHESQYDVAKTAEGTELVFNPSSTTTGESEQWSPSVSCSPWPHKQSRWHMAEWQISACRIEKLRRGLWFSCDSEKGRRGVLEVFGDTVLFHVCENESEIAQKEESCIVPPSAANFKVSVIRPDLRNEYIPQGPAIPCNTLSVCGW